MTPGLQALQGSVTAKVVFIGVLILILLIPLGMIEGLVSERQYLYGTARDDISRAWGQAQTVGGPILVVPFTYTHYVTDQTTVNAERRAITVKDELYVLPEQLEIRGSADAEERRRGIYKVPVYTMRLNATGRFPPVALDGGEYPDLAVLWSKPRSPCRSLTLVTCASRSCSRAATARLLSKRVASACRASARCSSRRMRRLG